VEYIPREDYLEPARALDKGTTKKIPHPGCTASNALMISNSSKGYSAYCFKCGLKGFTPHDYLSLGEQLAYRKAAQEEQQRQNSQQAICLPADFSLAIPVHGLVWLWKYGITDEEIVSFGIGWSERLKRVILPVYSEGKAGKKLVFWQGRAVSPDLKPKYLNIRSKTYGSVYFIRRVGDNGSISREYHDCNKRVLQQGGVHPYPNRGTSIECSPALQSVTTLEEDTPVYGLRSTGGQGAGTDGRASGHTHTEGRDGGCEQGYSKETEFLKDVRGICIVEDILSAIKVGRVCDAVSFLGSSITTSAYSLLRKYKDGKIILWYDSDQAGYKAARGFKKIFSGLCEYSECWTPRDPKEYSTGRTREILQELWQLQW